MENGRKRKEGRKESNDNSLSECPIRRFIFLMLFFSFLSFFFRYFKQSAATFFGLDESREGELRQRWEDRRRRLVGRRCGTLRESSTNLIDVRTISTSSSFFFWPEEGIEDIE